MKENKYLLNTLLAVVLGLALLAAVVTKTFLPWLCLPAVNIPLVAGISLIALLLDCYLAPGAERCWICIPLLSVVTFGLLPLAAGYVPAAQAGVLALVGGVVFTALTWLFTFASERLTSGRAGKVAPVMTALCLFLACQCFAGMIL